MVVRPASGDPASLRPAPDREERGPAEAAGAAAQAQGRLCTGERLRRGPRRRTDFPLHRPAFEGRQAGTPPVAAVDDACGDPRRLPEPARRQRPAAAGRCRGLPIRGRLAGRHQRHARDDRVQFQDRRLPQDHSRPRAVSDAGDPGRPGREDQALRLAPVFRDPWRVRGREGDLSRPLVRRDLHPGEGPAERRPPRSGTEGRAVVGRRARQCDRRQVPRQAGCGHRRDETVDPAVAAAVRPDQPAARGQRPLRLLGEDHAVDRPGPVREAQGAHLSANRLARVAGRLCRNRQCHAGSNVWHPLCEAGRTDPEVGLGEAEQAHLQQREGKRSLRHHPNADDAQSAVRGGREDLRPGHQALHGGVLPAGGIPADHAHHAGRGRAVQDRGQGTGEPGLAVGLR